ncbi:MAG: hypothetical protein AABZ74_00745 [Cyanobacteriota bacterium]
MVSKKDNYSKVLSEEEEVILKDCESEILNGLKSSFTIISLSLFKISENKLYKEKYNKFEDYCREKWDISRRYADNHIHAAKIIMELKNNSVDEKLFPLTESQFRALRKEKDNDTRIEILKEIYDSGKSITASLIETKIDEKNCLRKMKSIYKTKLKDNSNIIHKEALIELDTLKLDSKNIKKDSDKEFSSNNLINKNKISNDSNIMQLPLNLNQDEKKSLEELYSILYLELEKIKKIETFEEIEDILFTKLKSSYDNWKDNLDKNVSKYFDTEEAA